MSEKDYYNSSDEAYASREFLEEEFAPYLEEGEQILYVQGKGKGNAPLPIEGMHRKGVFKAVEIVITLVAAVVGMIFFLGIKKIISPDAVWDATNVIWIIPLIGITIGVVIVIKFVKDDPSKDVAVTSRRIMTLLYGKFEQISYDNITNVTYTIGKDNKGGVQIRTEEHYPRGIIANYWLESDDPQKLKYLIDQAFIKYKSGQA